MGMVGRRCKYTGIRCGIVTPSLKSAGEHLKGFDMILNKFAVRYCEWCTVVEFGEAIKNPAYRIPQTEYSGCLDISAHA